MADIPDLAELVALDDDRRVGDVISAFTDPVARYAFGYLLAEEQITLERLADVVTGWANAGSGRIATRSDRDRVHLLLYHVHIPRLESLDVVRFDADDRTVALGEASPAAASVLEWYHEIDRTIRE